MTLTALILPIVIITSAEALRAVPRTLREGGYGVGASRWQVTSRLVLPAARSGILTGTILALARALGETAPLLLAGAILGTYSSPGGLESLLTGPYTVLPMTVYDWARKPQEEFRALTVGGHHRPPRHHPLLQRPRHPPPQPVPEVVVENERTPQGDPVTVETQTQPSLDVRIGREAIDAGANMALDEDMASLPTAVSLRNVHLYYGAFRAVKDVSLDIPKNRDHRAHRAVRLRQVHAPPVHQPDERPHPVRARRGRDPLPRREPVRGLRRPGGSPAADRDGLPEGQPVPQVDLRQHRLRPPHHRDEGRHGPAGRVVPAPGGPLERGAGQARRLGARPVRRSAAAAVHRPGHRDRAGHDPHGRALLRPRPERPRSRSRS